MNFFKIPSVSKSATPKTIGSEKISKKTNLQKMTFRIGIRTSAFRDRVKDLDLHYKARPLKALVRIPVRKVIFCKLVFFEIFSLPTVFGVADSESDGILKKFTSEIPHFDIQTHKNWYIKFKK